VHGVGRRGLQDLVGGGGEEGSGISRFIRGDECAKLMPMLKFLLWNLNKKPLQDSIAALARRHEVDVIVLLENAVSSSQLLQTINPPGTGDYYFPRGRFCDKVHIFTKFHYSLTELVHESDRLTVRHIKLPGRTNILLAATHFPSKNYWTDESQALECANLADEIIDAEKLIGHTRTVLMGDLNMNPFESGVIGARGLNATMSLRIAQKQQRTIHSKTYPYFYNPMWGLFGNGANGPEATYYYSKAAEHVVQFWHMFDQVLVRPDLISAFKHDELKILKTDGNVSFLTRNGIPDKRNGSDHLPVLFALDI
jgi:exonuclease III